MLSAYSPIYVNMGGLYYRAQHTYVIHSISFGIYDLLDFVNKKSSFLLSFYPAFNYCELRNIAIIKQKYVCDGHKTRLHNATNITGGIVPKQDVKTFYCDPVFADKQTYI